MPSLAEGQLEGIESSSSPSFVDNGIRSVLVFSIALTLSELSPPPPPPRLQRYRGTSLTMRQRRQAHSQIPLTPT